MRRAPQSEFSILICRTRLERANANVQDVSCALGGLDLGWNRSIDRRQAYNSSKQNAALLHGWLADPANVGDRFGQQFGMNLSPEPLSGTFDGFIRDDTNKRPRFEVHSVRPAHRVSPDGDIRTEVIIVITQRRMVPIDPRNFAAGTFMFRGGCTLVVDPSNATDPIRYSIVKSIWSESRMDWQRRFQADQGLNLRSLYFDTDSSSEAKEPFALLHIGH